MQILQHMKQLDQKDQKVILVTKVLKEIKVIRETLATKGQLDHVVLKVQKGTKEIMELEVKLGIKVKLVIKDHLD